MAAPAEPLLRVLLVRHGQSANNVLLERSYSAFAGGRVSDAPLTPAGVAQALLTGAFLAGAQADLPAPLTAVYTSAMDRAVHTAAVLAARTGHRPVVWPDLHEVGGCFDNVIEAGSGRVTGFQGAPGMSRAHVGGRYPRALLPPEHGGGGGGGDDDGATRLTAAGWWLSAARESEADAVVRVARVLRALKRRAARLAESATMRPAVALAVGGGGGDASDVGAALAAALAASPTAHDAQAALAAAAPDAPGYRLAVDGAASGAAAAVASSWAAHAASETVALVCHGDFIDVLLRLAVGALRVEEEEDAGGGRRVRVVDAFAAAHGTSAQPGDLSPRELYGAGLDAPVDVAAVYAAATGKAPVPLRFMSHNCGVSWLDVHPDGCVRLVRVNDVRHLSGGGGGGVPALLPPAGAAAEVDGADDSGGADADAAVAAGYRRFIAAATAAYGHAPPWTVAPQAGRDADDVRSAPAPAWPVVPDAPALVVAAVTAPPKPGRWAALRLPAVACPLLTCGAAGVV